MRIVNQSAGSLSAGFWIVALLFAPFIFLPALALITPVYGAGWSADIAGTATRMRDRRTFDITSVLPDGLFGAYWFISGGVTHRNDAFSRLHTWGLWLIRFAVTGVLVSLVVDPSPTAGLPPGSPPPLFIDYVRSLAPHIIACVAVFFGHYQSVTLSILSGIFTADTVDSERDARLIAPAGFALLEIITYLVTWGIGGAIANVIAGDNTLLLSLSLVAAFVVVREFIVSATWAVTMERLNIGLEEQAMVMDGTRWPAIMQNEWNHTEYDSSD